MESNKEGWQTSKHQPPSYLHLQPVQTWYRNIMDRYFIVVTKEETVFVVADPLDGRFKRAVHGPYDSLEEAMDVTDVLNSLSQ